MWQIRSAVELSHICVEMAPAHVYVDFVANADPHKVVSYVVGTAVHIHALTNVYIQFIRHQSLWYTW